MFARMANKRTAEEAHLDDDLQQSQPQQQRRLTAPASSGATTSDSAALNARLSRKRTKTGCLTCRKRRIKCDEERPVCKNCIKSRRHCEGYNPRVVFKPPAFDYRPVANGAHIVFDAHPSPLSHVQYPIQPYASAATRPLGQSPLQPRPTEQAYRGEIPGVAGQYIAGPSRPIDALNPIVSPDVAYPQQQQVPPGFQVPFSTPEHVDRQPLIGPASFQSVPPSYYAQYPQSTYQHVRQGEPLQLNTAWTVPQQGPTEERWPYTASVSGPGSPSSSRSSLTQAMTHHSAPAASMAPWHSEAWTNRSSWVRPAEYHQLPQPHPPPPVPVSGMHANPAGSIPVLTTQTHDPSTQKYLPSMAQHNGANDATKLLRNAIPPLTGEEYIDPQSDEEMELDIFVSPSNDSERKQLLARLSHIEPSDLENAQPRQGDVHPLTRILDQYRVDEVAKPLQNPATARIFAFFIAAAGSTLSVFERQLTSKTIIDGHVPLPQQGLWTYAIPLAAMRHQGLMHALLAVSSLQIARLHGSDTRPSMQHYSCALKRIHSSVGRRSQDRLKLSTLAATMLLGFYELCAADDMKWSMHLSGAKQLISGVDFVGLLEQINHLKATRAEGLASGLGASLKASLLDEIQNVDEAFINRLTGVKVRYGVRDAMDAPTSVIPAQINSGHFEVLRDIFWLYLKQDAYQSIVSGNPLLLDYKNWLKCPPRSPIGRVDTPYGSFDHLVLLLGRVAEFAARDRRRKLKMMETNGGKWQSTFDSTSAQQPPPQQGALSAGSVVEMHRKASVEILPPALYASSSDPGVQSMGAAAPRRMSASSASSHAAQSGTTASSAPSIGENIHLVTATQAALEEYGRIRAALHMFARSLGSGFEPLESDVHPAVETPFGKALFYRSTAIACLWVVYHMTVIIAIRSHPHMHPAALVAAASAAQETAYFANEIGRINSGLLTPSPSQQLDPTKAAALCESVLPGFFAAVQYTSVAQRDAAITRITDLAARTRWGTAEVMANGIETAWVNLASMGKAPPYRRRFRRPRSDDSRLDGRWEVYDPRAAPDLKDDCDRQLIHRNPATRLRWAIGIIGTEADEALEFDGPPAPTWE